MTANYDEQTPPATLLERTLSILMLVIVGLSVACFLAVIVGTATGMTAPDFESGIWPIVMILPLFGLPIAFIMIIAVLILNARRRRAQRS